jgi:peptidoglycan/LPS O-acetylase OafA/YrhL
VAGEISYPLYILHGPLIVGAVGALKLLPVFSGPSDLRLLALAVLGSIVGSWVVLKVYDEPVRAWLARRTKRRVLAAA